MPNSPGLRAEPGDGMEEKDGLLKEPMETGRIRPADFNGDSVAS